MFNMLGAIAQFERELMLERQREGVAKAKAEGNAKAGLLQLGLRLLRFAGCTVKASGATEIAKRLRISRASVYRVLGIKNVSIERSKFIDMPALEFWSPARRRARFANANDWKSVSRQSRLRG